MSCPKCGGSNTEEVDYEARRARACASAYLSCSFSFGASASSFNFGISFFAHSVLVD